MFFYQTQIYIKKSKVKREKTKVFLRQQVNRSTSLQVETYHITPMKNKHDVIDASHQVTKPESESMSVSDFSF